ncbi:MAG: T9SS type A sorting domain-containing protein [Bacteroidetes bacterium]|nr:T9SS type A sorting domain-containing protein [Bacteroidota bacterium]
MTKIFAQCTPDTSIHKAGFYPKTLPDAQLNVAYEQTINFKIFKDTVVNVFGSDQTAIVDSAVIVNVKNMPPGLSFQLNKASKSYTPEEVGCALINGVPTKSGNFTLNIIIGFYAKVLGFPIFRADSINTFSIKVNGSNSFDNLSKNGFVFFPNPVKGNTIFLNLKNTLFNNEIKIFDNRGVLIYDTKTIEKSLKIDFDFPSGLYWILVNNCGYKFVKE